MATQRVFKRLMAAAQLESVITTLLAFSALRAGPAEHSASVEGTQYTMFRRKAELVPETAPRV